MLISTDVITRAIQQGKTAADIEQIIKYKEIEQEEMFKEGEKDSLHAGMSGYLFPCIDEIKYLSDEEVLETIVQATKILLKRAHR